MKKISVFFSILIMGLLIISSVFASSVVGVIGKYSNDEIIFKVRGRSSSYIIRRGGRRVSGSSRRLIFKIKSKTGYKILNTTKLKFRGKTYKFSARNVQNNYFKKGRIRIRQFVAKGVIVELEYFICKVSDDTCMRRVKKFKVVYPNGRLMTGQINKIILKEIAN